MLLEVARLLGADAPRQVNLVDGHVVDQTLVLDGKGCGEGVQCRLDEVGERECRAFLLCADIGRDQHELSVIDQRRLARDAEMVGQIVLDQGAEGFG